MNREKLSDILTGMEYPFSVPENIKEELIHTDLVVVYGASDDLMEFEGAINDEVGCYDGGKAYINKDGMVDNGCNDDDCPYFEQLKEKSTVIEALWCAEDNIPWTYKTKIPHSTFKIIEDGEVYCRGIIFDLCDVKA